MKLFCFKCDGYKEVSAVPSGPHIKGICSQCGAYMKFLSKADMKMIEAEENQKEQKQ